MLSKVFLLRIPTHRPAESIAVDSHTARNRHAETEVERTIRLFPRAHAIEEIQHVLMRERLGIARHLHSRGRIHFLRQIAQLRGALDSSVVAEYVLRN